MTQSASGVNPYDTLHVLVLLASFGDSIEYFFTLGEEPATSKASRQARQKALPFRDVVE